MTMTMMMIMNFWSWLFDSDNYVVQTRSSDENFQKINNMLNGQGSSYNLEIFHLGTPKT